MNAEKAREHYKNSTIIPLIDDIYDLVTWGDFSKSFFPDHSVSWFYNKMRGVDGNGGVGSFTPDEIRIFKGGLVEIADRIRKAADKL